MILLSLQREIYQESYRNTLMKLLLYFNIIDYQKMFSYLIKFHKQQDWSSQEHGTCSQKSLYDLMYDYGFLSFNCR